MTALWRNGFLGWNDMKRCLLALVALALLSACVPQTGSGEFLAPEIVSTEVVAGVGEARLRCTLSEPRVERCGFAYAVAGAQFREVACELAGSSFELLLEGLTPGATYEWYAFAAAGESEVRSETARFTLEPLPPEEKVKIPDQVFKTYLTEHFDTDDDGEISLYEALRVRKIVVKTDDIFSLEGIESFTNLDTLVCRGVDPDHDEYSYDGWPGRLRSLDLSANTRLRKLECDGNNLLTLILPDSPWLEFVRCSHNRLKELDLSSLSDLRLLQAFNNDLSSVDFSGNPIIETIEIGGNPIESIDVTCCPKLGVLNIGGLKVKELVLSGCPELGWLGVHYTDLTSLDLSGNPKLQYLDCFNTGIISLDLSPCPKLYELKCWDCQIENLDISMLPGLEIMQCSPMATLKTLYVSEDQQIEGVTVNRSEESVPAGTKIIVRYAGAPDGIILFEDPYFKAYLVSVFDRDNDGEISLEEASDVYKIHVCSNEWNITSLQGIEFMPNLEFLCCSGEWLDTNVMTREHYYISKHYHWDHLIGPIGTLKKVDVSHNPKLYLLDVSNNSGIGDTGTGYLDVSHNPELTELYLTMCYVRYPDVRSCPKLKRLGLSHCYGDVPDLSNNPELVFLDVGHEQRGRQQAVDVSHCPILEEMTLDASASSLSDLSFNPRLKSLRISWCGNIKLDLSTLSSLELLECIGNDLSSLDLSGMGKLRSLNCSGNPIGEIDLSGITGLRRLECSSCGLASLDISGQGYLDYLDCQWNSLTSIDMKNNPYLTEIYIAGNPLKAVDVASNPALDKLYCGYTEISELDVSHNTVLWDLRCEHNALESLDLSANLRLWGLYCDDNKLNGLDLSRNINLEELDCSSNRMDELDVTHNPLLRWLVCGNNFIKTLDVSQNRRLQGPNGDNITGLYCAPMNDGDGRNVLETIWIKRGQKIQGVTEGRSTEHIPSQTTIKEK